MLSLVAACNFAKHLKALKWKTPFQSICDAWKSNPSGCIEKTRMAAELAQVERARRVVAIETIEEAGTEGTGAENQEWLPFSG